MKNSEMHNWGELHSIIQTITWFGLEKLLLWGAHFKNFKYGIVAHAFFGILAAGLMMTGSFMMIFSIGPEVITRSLLHKTLGFVLLLTMPLILISGATCKIQQLFSGISPKRVYIGNWGHTIFGWAVIILSKIPLYASRSKHQTGLMMILMVIDIIYYGSFFLFKFFL